MLVPLSVDKYAPDHRTRWRGIELRWLVLSRRIRSKYTSFTTEKKAYIRNVFTSPITTTHYLVPVNEVFYRRIALIAWAFNFLVFIHNNRKYIYQVVCIINRFISDSIT